MSLASRLNDARISGVNVDGALAKFKINYKLEDNVNLRVEGLRPDELETLDTSAGLVDVYAERMSVKASEKVERVTKSTEVSGSLGAGWIAEELGVDYVGRKRIADNK